MSPFLCPRAAGSSLSSAGTCSHLQGSLYSLCHQPWFPPSSDTQNRSPAAETTPPSLSAGNHWLAWLTKQKYPAHWPFTACFCAMLRSNRWKFYCARWYRLNFSPISPHFLVSPANHSRRSSWHCSQIKQFGFFAQFLWWTEKRIRAFCNGWCPGFY